MTTTLAQFGNWIVTEEQKVVATFESDEALVIAYAMPLIKQIEASINALGKATFAEGLQVLEDAAKAAVTAGAEAAPGGLEAVGAAATAAFIATGASEGLTVVKNAEAGAIKIAVAAAQSADVPPAVTPDVPADAAEPSTETPAV